MKRIKFNPELAASLKGQKKAFREKFRREPGPGDPVFFNTDAEEPQFLTQDQRNEITDAMYQIILMTGIDPAFAYAFRKTGRLLTERNMKSATPVNAVSGASMAIDSLMLTSRVLLRAFV